MKKIFGWIAITVGALCLMNVSAVILHSILYWGGDIEENALIIRHVSMSGPNTILTIVGFSFLIVGLYCSQVFNRAASVRKRT